MAPDTRSDYSRKLVPWKQISVGVVIIAVLAFAIIGAASVFGGSDAPGTQNGQSANIQQTATPAGESSVGAGVVQGIDPNNMTVRDAETVKAALKDLNQNVVTAKSSYESQLRAINAGLSFTGQTRQQAQSNPGYQAIEDEFSKRKTALISAVRIHNETSARYNGANLGYPEIPVDAEGLPIDLEK